MDANTALLEVYWHAAKLSAAVKNNDGPAIQEHSADVANMAMMVLDICGGLAWVEVAADRAQRSGVSADPLPDPFTEGVNTAAAMLDKMADDYSDEHGRQDPDTGAMEFGRGAKEDYYNTLRELADDIRGIVHGNAATQPPSAKNVRESALDEAANLVECEHAPDAAQGRRLQEIAQHIRDLKKRGLQQ